MLFNLLTVSQVSSTESRDRGRYERAESGEISESSEAGDQVVIELERDDRDIQGEDQKRVCTHKVFFL